MRNNPLWLFVITTIASNAFASSPELAGISVGELGKVQSETILFKAKAERAKAEREILQGDSTTESQTASNGFASTLLPSQPMATANQEGLPVIKAVTGSARKLQATLLYSSGIEIDASMGRELPGGYRVALITLDGVTLERKGKRFPLGFSNRPPSPASQPEPAMPQPASAFPGLIPTQP